MSEKIIFEPTPEQFGIFWKYLSRPEVTDVDYNGQKLWITDLKEGRYCANEEIPEYFISTFTRQTKQLSNRNVIIVFPPLLKMKYSEFDSDINGVEAATAHINFVASWRISSVVL